MSSLIVRVRKFTRLPHPNADTLFIAIPDGTSWQCCCRIADFENEELGIYIPVDSLLPVDMVNELKLPNSKEGEPFRMRTCRLRSKLSQGLLLPNNGRFKEGDDVAEILGITKYVEPEPDDEDLRTYPLQFTKYTNIEDIKNYPKVFVDGEEVIITEKLHGSTLRAGWVEGEFYCGSGKTAFKPDANSKWLDIAKKYNLEEKLRNLPGVIIYGELFGAGVQKLRYDLDNSWDFRLFDAYDVVNDEWYNWQELYTLAIELGVKEVPLLYSGPYSKEVVLEHTIGKSTMAGHVREGCVIKCAHVPRYDVEYGLGRVILKSLNPDYLLKNYD
jgi:RNA ligase (TIGR02306 family)